jgi:hypothetical protein
MFRFEIAIKMISGYREIKMGTSGEREALMKSFVHRKKILGNY